MKFHASYTALNLWNSGNYERAVEAYFHLQSFTSEAMADGKTLHDQWEKEVKETGCLPKIFGGKKLIKPIVEEKRLVQIYDWLELSYKIDLLDDGVIYDYKSGKGSSESAISTKQLGVYGVGCTFDKIKVTKGQILHYDQYKKTVDTSSVWLTDTLLEDTLNWIVTLSSDMHTYLTDNKLYERFGKN